MSKKLNIAVTDIAPLCRMDHYDNLAKILCKYWKSLNPKHYTKYKELCYADNIPAANDSIGQKIKVLGKKIVGDNLNINDEIKKINSKTNSSSELVTKQAKLIESITTLTSQKRAISTSSNNDNKNDTNELFNLIKSSTNVVYGSKNEDRGYGYFTYNTGIEVKVKQKYIKTKILSITETTEHKTIDVFINGYIDGLTEKNELLEIKNRRSHLFKILRDYEECQVQTYMHMLGLTNGYLVEIKDNNNLLDGTILKINYNQDYYDSIVKKNLLKAIEFIISLIFSVNVPIIYTEDEKHHICLELIKGDKNKIIHNLIYC